MTAILDAEEQQSRDLMAEKQAREAVAQFIARHNLPAPKTFTWETPLGHLDVHVSPADLLVWVSVTRKRLYLKAKRDIYGCDESGRYGEGPGYFACLDISLTASGRLCPPRSTRNTCAFSVLASWRTDHAV